MDGSVLVSERTTALSALVSRQQTLRNGIDCTGVALHSGRRVRTVLRPAASGAGLVFRRTDLGIDIPARFDHVVDTRLCTVLGAPDRPEATVGTVEHLMAALSARRISNLLVEVDGPELPVLDGSAEPWLFLIDCAGIVGQDAPRAEIQVLQPVRVTEGDAFAELRPSLSATLDLSVAIEFAAPAIGRQSLTLTLDELSFRDVARARTFTQAHEVEGLRQAGLARGGSLDNAVVVDGADVLNPGGLRMPDEFVRHKLLDAVGDLALGGPLRGRFVGCRIGHALNNRLLRALFADPANWREIRNDGLGWMREAA